MSPGLTDDRPIYLQIKEYLEGEILAARLKAGDQIPSTNQLVSYFNINPITVLKGVGLLAAEKILYKKRGVGIFVSPDAPELLRKKRREVFAAELIMPMAHNAKLIGLSLSALQKLIEQVWEEV